MFKVTMLEFGESADPIIYDSDMPYAAFFFVSFVFVAGIVMTNVIVAVLLDKYLDNDPILGLSHHEDDDDDALQQDTFPTLYLNRDGVLMPLRSITYDQLEQVNH